MKGASLEDYRETLEANFVCAPVSTLGRLAEEAARRSLLPDQFVDFMHAWQAGHVSLPLGFGERFLEAMIEGVTYRVWRVEYEPGKSPGLQGSWPAVTAIPSGSWGQGNQLVNLPLNLFLGLINKAVEKGLISPKDVSDFEEELLHRLRSFSALEPLWGLAEDLLDSIRGGIESLTPVNAAVKFVNPPLAS